MAKTLFATIVFDDTGTHFYSKADNLTHVLKMKGLLLTGVNSSSDTVHTLRVSFDPFEAAIQAVPADDFLYEQLEFGVHEGSNFAIEVDLEKYGILEEVFNNMFFQTSHADLDGWAIVFYEKKKVAINYASLNLI